MRQLIFITSFLLIIASCKKDGQSTRNYIAPFNLHSYPMAMGNKWAYKTDVIVTDSTGAIIFHDTYGNFWTVVRDTLINGQLTTKVNEVDSNYNGTVHIANCFYSNVVTGLYGVAYENLGSMILLRSAYNLDGIHFMKAGINDFSLLKCDTVITEDTAAYFLKFPITLNDIWQAHEYDPTIHFKRKWCNYDTIATPAGNFACVKLQAFYDQDNDYLPDSLEPIFYQYFGNKGLVKETRNYQLFLLGGSTGYLNQTTQLISVNF